VSTRLNYSLNDEVVNGINSVLSDAGIESDEVEIPAGEELSHVQKIFKARGAGIEAAASRIASLMNDDKPEIALRAAEISLKANSVYTDAEKKVKVPSVVINILSSGEAKTLLNLVVPVS
jgi:hypothetical protein